MLSTIALVVVVLGIAALALLNARAVRLPRPPRTTVTHAAPSPADLDHLLAETSATYRAHRAADIARQATAR